MISVAEARERVLRDVALQPREWVALPQAHGRVLACDLHALRTQPPHAVSAMDGYAVRAADARAGARLRLVGEVPAGRRFEGRLCPGQAVRIFTGAPLPEGADAILIQERAEPGDGFVIAREEVEPGRFVRPAGLDFESGWKGLEAGTVLDARRLGLAAAMGHVWIPVRRRPRVAILATGDELVPPGTSPQGAQITSSNSTVIGAMVAGWGGEASDLGIARDDPGTLRDALEQARSADLLVTTGGASVGEYDFVQEVAHELGLELDFWKIAMRPGKPLIFGRLGAAPFLGLPGNPVSAAVCALIFLRSMLRQSLGLDPALPTDRAPLAVDLPANDERHDWLRAFWCDGDDGRRVLPASRQDSSMYATFARADVLVSRPPFDPPRRAGEMVEIVEIDRALTL